MCVLSLTNGLGGLRLKDEPMRSDLIPPPCHWIENDKVFYICFDCCDTLQESNDNECVLCKEREATSTSINQKNKSINICQQCKEIKEKYQNDITKSIKIKNENDKQISEY